MRYALVTLILALALVPSSGAYQFQNALQEVRYLDTNGGTCEPVVFYDDAKACGTLEQAYVASQLGDTVIVRDGSYPSQTVRALVSKGQPDDALPVVRFQAEGSGARFAAIHLYAPHVGLTGLEVNGQVSARYRPEKPSVEASGNVHLDRLRVVDGGRISLAAIKNFSITNSLIADNFRDAINIYGSASGNGDAGHYPQFGLVENNVIRDLRLIDDDHIDGIQFTTGLDIVVRGNVLGPRIHHQGILAKTDKGPIQRVRFEGNTFHPTIDPGFTFMAHRFNGRPCDSIEIVGNNFLKEPTPRSLASEQCQGVMTGNTFASMSAFNCSRWVQSYEVRDNIFLAGDPCGTVSDPEPPPPPPPAPEPPPPPYEPACAPVCDEEIAALEAQVLALEDEVGFLQAQISDFEAFVARYDEWIAEAP